MTWRAISARPYGGAEQRGRRVPGETPFRLLVDVVPPATGALRVELVLHR